MVNMTDFTLKHMVLRLLTIAAAVSALLSGCKPIEKEENSKDYGVFISLDSSDMDEISEYETVVIDAQFFTQKDIASLKKQGCTVYSYINVGSVENFRDYYDSYSDLTLGAYENWDEERWVDVSSDRWKKFMATLADELSDKGIDGFFVDNCDVYYVYPTDDIFEGLTGILENLMQYDKPVIINGGDTYVIKYMEIYGSPERIMTGVNQESVWSKINFDTGEFFAQTEDDREYFREYIETCDRCGLDVYLIEYTTDSGLKDKIKKYCDDHGFRYFISDSIELDRIN